MTIFGPKRYDRRGKWWNLHDEEINYFYSSSDWPITKVTESRNVEQARYVCDRRDENRLAIKSGEFLSC
jgi:hypothetical protein